MDEERTTTDVDPSGGESGEQGAYPSGDSDAGPQTEPVTGGYADRDPKTDMPRIPSAPETQEDSRSHDADPPDDDEPIDPYE